MNRFKQAGLLMVTLSIVVAACGQAAIVPTATVEPNAVYTAAAQTADARLTELAQVTPTTVPATPTPDTLQTAAVATMNALQTQAAAITPTPAATSTSTTAPTAALADRAEFVQDVTVPDGSDFSPGASFTKTWRIKNSGTSTWTTAYALTFISGDKMGDQTSVALSGQVAPGESVDISVALVAPNATGKYRGYWKMTNAAGQLFDDSVYVEIDVVGAGGATATPTTPGAGNPITNLSMAVDQASYTGACPHSVTFAASFTLNSNATLTYVLEAGSDTPGFQFNLPPAQTSTFSAGTYSLNFPLDFTSSVNGWVRLHILSPVDITTNQVSFSVTCQ